jgi:hypothetical protein
MLKGKVSLCKVLPYYFYGKGNNLALIIRDYNYGKISGK